MNKNNNMEWNENIWNSIEFKTSQNYAFFNKYAMLSSWMHLIVKITRLLVVITNAMKIEQILQRCYYAINFMLRIFLTPQTLLLINLLILMAFIWTGLFSSFWRCSLFLFRKKFTKSSSWSNQNGSIHHNSI